MHEKLFIKIQEFTILIEGNLKISQLIYQCTLNKQWDAIEHHSNNRDRSLSIIAQTQIDIEKLINSLSSEELDFETINIIKSWAQETQSWINKTIEVDQNILVNLENEKEHTTNEIVRVFKSKQAFKGYDLSNVSK